ncbi:MAG TPA: hypothetical protein VLE53_06495 [Gemmatimonadaceae bacterium]|nr:hypothetical protein [Gemmatimonadaceae bacterium]
MHRGTMTVLLLALLACGDESDPFAPRTPAAPTAAISGPAIPTPLIDALPAVQDALDRLIPNLASVEGAVAIDGALRQVLAALRGTSEADLEAALAAVRHEIGGYTTMAGDDAEIDAVRLALEALQ